MVPSPGIKPRDPHVCAWCSNTELGRRKFSFQLETSAGFKPATDRFISPVALSLSYEAEMAAGPPTVSACARSGYQETSHKLAD